MKDYTKSRKYTRLDTITVVPTNEPESSRDLALSTTSATAALAEAAAAAAAVAVAGG
jgi:hypothetical protein